MKEYIQRLKSRAQLIILVGNTMLVLFNLLYVSFKFDNMNNKQIFTCEMTSPYTSQCYER